MLIRLYKTFFWLSWRDLSTSIDILVERGKQEENNQNHTTSHFCLHLCHKKLHYWSVAIVYSYYTHNRSTIQEVDVLVVLVTDIIIINHHYKSHERNSETNRRNNKRTPNKPLSTKTFVVVVVVAYIDLLLHPFVYRTPSLLLTKSSSYVCFQDHNSKRLSDLLLFLLHANRRTAL